MLWFSENVGQKKTFESKLKRVDLSAKFFIKSDLKHYTVCCKFFWNKMVTEKETCYHKLYLLLFPNFSSGGIIKGFRLKVMPSGSPH